MSFSSEEVEQRSKHVPRMKAAIRTRYGPPDVLSVVERAIPTPKANQVLVRVCATTVNRTDCGILWGAPFVIRFFTGLPRPRSPVTGTDFAGRIEAVGPDVKSFKIGDKVFGFDDNGLGSHAQYMVLAEDKPVALIPGGVSYEQAAASLEGAHYARNFINKVQLAPGHKVLVNGATGAIGSAAVQLLKVHGAYVTAVCDSANVDLVKSLGADRVIDYTKEDFTQDGERYHFVFDAVGKSTFGKCKRLLREKGTYISSELGPKAENPLLALITPLFGGKKVRFPIPLDSKASITLVKELLETQRFRPVIDRRYPLSDIAEAFDYVASGRKIGNVILTMGEGDPA